MSITTKQLWVKMSSLTWDEYLANASEHLEAIKLALSAGGQLPRNIDQPLEPMPVELTGKVLAMQSQYQELAETIKKRMRELQRREAVTDRWNGTEMATPRYVNIQG